MPTVEERITAVEGKIDAIADLRAVVGKFRADMRQELAAVRTEMRQQFAEVRTDLNRRSEQVDRRLEVLDHRVERHFMWMVGIQFTVLIAVIVALIETSAR